jgi:hypothetical protein
LEKGLWSWTACSDPVGEAVGTKPVDWIGRASVNFDRSDATADDEDAVVDTAGKEDMRIAPVDNEVTRATFSSTIAVGPLSVDHGSATRAGRGEIMILAFTTHPPPANLFFCNKTMHATFPKKYIRRPQTLSPGQRVPDGI